MEILLSKFYKHISPRHGLYQFLIICRMKYLNNINYNNNTQNNKRATFSFTLISAWGTSSIVLSRKTWESVRLTEKLILKEKICSRSPLYRYGIPITSFSYQNFIQIKWISSVWKDLLVIWLRGQTQQLLEDTVIETFSMYYSYYTSWIKKKGGDKKKLPDIHRRKMWCMFFKK